MLNFSLIHSIYRIDSFQHFIRRGFYSASLTLCGLHRVIQQISSWFGFRTTHFARIIGKIFRHAYCCLWWKQLRRTIRYVIFFILYISRTSINGTLGGPAIQLAKLSGFSPIITTASLTHSDALKAIGATHILDRSLDKAALLSDIKSITNDAPIKTIVDAISSEPTQQTAFDLISPGGQVAVFSPALHETTNEKKFIRAVAFSTLPANVDLFKTLYHDKLEGFLREGVIKVR